MPRHVAGSNPQQEERGWIERHCIGIRMSRGLTAQKVENIQCRRRAERAVDNKVADKCCAHALETMPKFGDDYALLIEPR